MKIGYKYVFSFSYILHIEVGSNKSISMLHVPRPAESQGGLETKIFALFITLWLHLWLFLLKFPHLSIFEVWNLIENWISFKRLI